MPSARCWRKSKPRCRRRWWQRSRRRAPSIPAPLPGEDAETWAARAAATVSGSIALASIVAALVPSITALVQAGIEHGEALVGIPLDFNVNDDAAQRFIAEYGLRIAEKLQETTLAR